VDWIFTYFGLQPKVTGAAIDPKLASPPPSPPKPIPQAIAPTEEQSVQQRIQQANPSLSSGDAATAAQDCVNEEAAGRAAGTLGPADQPCLNAQLFFPGSNAGWAAIHDLDAISSNPAWFQLTYLSRSAKKASGVPPGWYSQVQWRAKYGTRGCPVLLPAGLHCDEYPFYTTVEGGPPNASLLAVPSRDNSSEGASLHAMQYDPNCNMAVNVAGAVTYQGSGQQ